VTSHLYLQNPPKGGRAAAQHHVMWPPASRAWLHLLQSIYSTATIHVPCTASITAQPPCPVFLLSTAAKKSQRMRPSTRCQSAQAAVATRSRFRSLSAIRRSVGHPIQSHTGVRYAVMLPTSEAPWCVVVCTCNDQHAMPQHTGSQPLEHSCDYY